MSKCPVSSDVEIVAGFHILQYICVLQTAEFILLPILYVTLFIFACVYMNVLNTSFHATICVHILQRLSVCVLH